MQGFLAVVGAMVLQAVGELSDDGGAPPPAPPGPEPKALPKAKAGATPKKLLPKAKTSAAKSKPKQGMRKPAASSSRPSVPEPAQAAETETPTTKGPKKRPASEAEKPLVVRKNYYKTDKRYGFVVGKREVMYVTSLHSCGLQQVPNQDVTSRIF
jgi:hypothetical protein